MEPDGRRREEVGLTVLDLLDHARVHVHKLGQALLGEALGRAQPPDVRADGGEEVLMRAVARVGHAPSWRRLRLTTT